MKIAFVTTQSMEGSTVVGRVLPLAYELSSKHDVHILIHKSPPVSASPLKLHTVGQNPFTKTDSRKKRKKGISLIWQMLSNAIKTTYTLFKIKPKTVVIVKSLPQNVLAVKLWHLFNTKANIILDIDDFELTANLLTSNTQRAAIHWAERAGSRIAKTIVAASPFLKDHFEQLTNHQKKVVMIQTGLSIKETDTRYGDKQNLLYIGSVSESSGHKVSMLPDILFNVKKEIPSINLHIAGNGDDVESLKKSFADKKLTDSVIWHGRFSMEKIHDFFDNKTVIIDPIDSSINNRAKSSFRVALACIMGLPVVTSNIGIRPYLLPETLHNRFFANPEDPSDYAKKIIDLLHTPLSFSDSASLKIHAKNNTWQKLGNKYEKIIN